MVSKIRHSKYYNHDLAQKYQHCKYDMLFFDWTKKGTNVLYR